jgi:hypothetical protein
MIESNYYRIQRKGVNEIEVRDKIVSFMHKKWKQQNVAGLFKVINNLSVQNSFRSVLPIRKKNETNNFHWVLASL